MAIFFSNRRVTSVAELAREVIKLVQQLGTGAEGRLLLDQSVAVTETAIAHGLNGPPRYWTVTPQAASSITRSKASDALNIYAIATVACTADFMIYP